MFSKSIERKKFMYLLNLDGVYLTLQSESGWLSSKATSSGDQILYCVFLICRTGPASMNPFFVILGVIFQIVIPSFMQGDFKNPSKSPENIFIFKWSQIRKSRICSPYSLI